MIIDEVQINKILKALASEHQRKIIGLVKLSGLYYTEILKLIAPYESNAEKSSKIAYHIKTLKDAGIIAVDDKTKIYYLTCIGVQAYELIQQFNILCMKYDLSDCDADGKPVKYIMIEGRKL